MGGLDSHRSIPGNTSSQQSRLRRRPRTSQSMRSTSFRATGSTTFQSTHGSTLSADLEATGATTNSAASSSKLGGTQKTLSSCSDLQATQSTIRSHSTGKASIPTYLRLQTGMLSTINAPPTAQAPVRCDNPPEWVNPERPNTQQRRRTIQQQLKAPRNPPKLTSREEIQRRYNKQTFGDYEPLPLCIPEQQTRYLAAGSIMGRNPSISDPGIRSIMGRHDQPPKTAKTDSRRSEKKRQMPVRGQGDARTFLNNLYVEEPTYSSMNWRPMFRTANDCMVKDPKLY